MTILEMAFAKAKAHFFQTCEKHSPGETLISRTIRQVRFDRYHLKFVIGQVAVKSTPSINDDLPSSLATHLVLFGRKPSLPK